MPAKPTTSGQSAQSPTGDLGAQRQTQARKGGARQFRKDGPDVRAASFLPYRAPKVASDDGRHTSI